VKRWAARIVLFLLVGALVSYAVAGTLSAWPWGDIVWLEESSGYSQLQGSFRSSWTIRIKRRRGVERIDSQWLSNSAGSGTPLPHSTHDVSQMIPAWAESRLQSPPIEIVRPQDPPWDQLRFERGAPRGRRQEVVQRAGWPFFCAIGMVRIDGREVVSKSPMKLRFAATSDDSLIVRLTPPPGVDFGMGSREDQQMFRLLRQVPLAPIWPGLALNALFYAAILWLLWSTPGAIRRTLRRRRRRCVSCGYDLRGAASSSTDCPECGGTMTS
jgi:hypothetical protein